MHPAAAAWTGLLIVGKVIFDALTWQVFRQRSATALLSCLRFNGRQASLWKADNIAFCAVGFILIRNLFGFIEDAINVLFAARRKTMQPRQRELFLKFKDAFGELTVLRLQRSNARHQLLNSWFACPTHQSLESKAYRDVNCRIREPSAGNLIVPHPMADHRIDIDAVENPV